MAVQVPHKSIALSRTMIRFGEMQQSCQPVLGEYLLRLGGQDLAKSQCGSGSTLSPLQLVKTAFAGYLPLQHPPVCPCVEW
jgi:hypothetical protein